MTSVFPRTTTNMTETPILQPGETCSTLADPDDTDRTLCRQWRSCRSCLQKTGCMINASNKCVNASDYNATLDYRKAIAAGVTLPNATVSNAQGLQANQSWEFRAGDAKYCAADDATCTECTNESFYRASGDAIDSRFCVGASGCICIYNCEFFVQGALIADCSYTAPVSGSLSSANTSVPLPSPTSASPTTSDSSGTRVDPAVVAIGGVVVVLVVGLCVFVQRRQAKRRQEERTRQLQAGGTRQQRSRGVEIKIEPLSLSGWSKHHDKQVVSENRKLAGEEDDKTTAFTKLESPLNAATGEEPPAQTRL